MSSTRKGPSQLTILLIRETPNQIFHIGENSKISHVFHAKESFPTERVREKERERLNQWQQEATDQRLDFFQSNYYIILSFNLFSKYIDNIY